MISVTRVLQWSEIFQDQSSVRVAALGIISVVICACVDDCSRWALHEPRSWISFAVTSLAYCLVFLRKVNLTIFCVFWCNYVVLAFVVPYVYFNVNVEDAISQEGGVCYGFKFDRNIRDGSGFILLALAPPEVLFASVCALFESALCLPCCSEQDAVAPVTKDIDQVNTLIELYFMFNSLEIDKDNIFSQSGEQFVFYLYFLPRLWLFTRSPNWSFQKFSFQLVRSIRIPICDALVQNSNCFQITIGCITLSAVINVLGYMLLVVIFVLFGNVRHIVFVAWLIGRHIGFRHIG